MANLDAACGVNLKTLNSLLSEYYASACATGSLPYPISGTSQQNVDSVGEVAVSWQVDAAPVLTFGPPSQDTWNASLDPAGATNEAAGNPLPSNPAVQLAFPTLTAFVTVGGAAPVGGETKNVAVYATLTFSAGQVATKLVGLTVDRADFSALDQAIFDDVLVPQLFTVASQLVGVIQLPALTWDGVSLNPIQLSIAVDRLSAATTLTTNTTPLDLTGVTFPDDPVFLVASNSLINAALMAGIASFTNKTFADSGDYNGLADWDYSGQYSAVSATVNKVSPLTIDASLDIQLTVGAQLTQAGRDTATAVCTLGTFI